MVEKFAVSSVVWFVLVTMKTVLFPNSKSGYEVQYVFPVDKPEDNVSIVRRKTGDLFLVPCNHPLAHQMGYVQLLSAAARKDLLDSSTPLNTESKSLEIDFRVSNGNNP